MNKKKQNRSKLQWLLISVFFLEALQISFNATDHKMPLSNEISAARSVSSIQFIKQIDEKKLCSIHWHSCQTALEIMSKHSTNIGIEMF